MNMNITYEYQIINVDEQARCMEVVYSSEGRQTMHISARLPYKGEALEDVIKMFAPVLLWIEAGKTVVPPATGTRGQIILVPEAPRPADAPQPTVEGAQTL